jgi:hypothetical protein
LWDIDLDESDFLQIHLRKVITKGFAGGLISPIRGLLLVSLNG